MIQMQELARNRELLLSTMRYRLRVTGQLRRVEKTQAALPGVVAVGEEAKILKTSSNTLPIKLEEL